MKLLERTLGTEDSLAGVKWQRREADILLQSVPTLVVELYLHFPIRLHGKIIN
jgi:hypothetical protein